MTKQEPDPATWQISDHSAADHLARIFDFSGAVSRLSSIAGGADAYTYAPTRDSLLEYKAPEWYLDAKLGIWAHWIWV